ncbi:MAG: hypothetical protein NVV82_26640 [Sporocytophaga sp.]|nr:hypothetical protein [Sporocytophaga sp.]
MILYSECLLYNPQVNKLALICGQKSEDFSQRGSAVAYIHDNPVKAGIVRCPEDYIYSSAFSPAGVCTGRNLSITA